MVSYAANAFAEDLKPTSQILLIDYGNTNLDLLELYLLRAGYKVSRASDGTNDHRLYHQYQPDLILLELEPHSRGLGLLRRLRTQFHLTIPIIVVSANNREEDKVQGLEEGADDYITRPFSIAELLMRIKVALRRGQEQARYSDRSFSNSYQEVRTPDGLYISKTRHRVELNGTEVELRPKEFELLWFLATHPGRVFSREQVLEEVWNYAGFGDLSTITVHMRRLREKVEIDPMQPRHLKTVWGLGYKFEP